MTVWERGPPDIHKPCGSGALPRSDGAEPRPYTSRAPSYTALLLEPDLHPRTRSHVGSRRRRLLAGHAVAQSVNFNAAVLRGFNGGAQRLAQK